MPVTQRGLGWNRLLPPALRGIRNAKRVPVFSHGPAGNVHTFLAQGHDKIFIRQDRAGGLVIDQRTDALANRLGAVTLPAAQVLNRLSKEIF